MLHAERLLQISTIPHPQCDELFAADDDGDNN
jgi:hypothetical protein